LGNPNVNWEPGSNKEVWNTLKEGNPNNIWKIGKEPLKKG